MGAKGSKDTQKVVHISSSDIIDPSDATIFPEKVRNELMAVKVPPSQLFLVKEFDGDSELVKWLHRSRSYFAYEGEDENENRRPYERTFINNLLNMPNGNTAAYQAPRRNESTTNSLVMRLQALAQKGGTVEKDKNPFLLKLDGMCNTPHIRTEFLANLLEVENRILFAFLHTGHIAGFSILGEDNKNNCLHRYVTCTGPRKLGIGAGLVNKIHEIAKREGYTCVSLGATDSIGFHKKMGYVATGKHTQEGNEMIYRVSGGKRRKTRKQRK
jgi:hypothetical protein